VVTRDELRERLWSGDTFVDFDQGLKIAISKLRETLGATLRTLRIAQDLEHDGLRSAAQPLLEVLLFTFRQQGRYKVHAVTFLDACVPALTKLQIQCSRSCLA
jgi:hypothetical protein